MTYYVYDLETSGASPKSQRIMQFAGQRLDQNWQPITEIDNKFVKLSDDVLPEPYAVLTHGLTPQSVNANGLSEADFLKWFEQSVATPRTVFVGFNNIRFDDEFMRYSLYRNFYDPYRWQWQDGRGKWDIMDVARMARALRPEGIEWPYGPDGKPSVRLELLTGANKIEHQGAHSADSDVTALVAFINMLRQEQPKLFEYLLSTRSKDAVNKLIEASQPFVYTSGQYRSEHEKTTIVVPIGKVANIPGSYLVYDLRYDPDELRQLSPVELSERINLPYEQRDQRLPIKKIATNRCPAVAPLSVLDKPSVERIKIDTALTASHLSRLDDSLKNRLVEAYEIAQTQKQAGFISDSSTVDEQLYDGFYEDHDQNLLPEIRQADPDDIMSFEAEFKDQRLSALSLLYKARNYPDHLKPEEQSKWQAFRIAKLLKGKHPDIVAFSRQFDSALNKPGLTPNQQFLLEELKLYVESILPVDD